ncbi:type II secretion system protein, partial [bacterium]|nr:type II secretion system protein [bacterium]
MNFKQKLLSLTLTKEKTSEIKNEKFLKSFTLIELLVVIALFALLLGIVIIHVKNARQKAKIAKILTWSKSIHSRLG